MSSGTVGSSGAAGSGSGEASGGASGGGSGGGSGGPPRGDSSNSSDRGNSGEGGRGFYRHPCCNRYSRPCDGWVWQNGDACGNCLGLGWPSKREEGKSCLSPATFRRSHARSTIKLRERHSWRSEEEPEVPRPIAMGFSAGAQQPIE